MKTLFLSITLALTTLITYAQDGTVKTYQVNSGSVTSQGTDSVRLQVDGNNAYYQKTVKVDSNIKVSAIYLRTLQFMATKNFQQTYGYEEEGKLIFATTQDLNITPVSITDDADNVDPFTTQFAITVEMKNGRYRYTIQNVIFYIPAQDGNRRLTLYDMYQKLTNKDSKRIARQARTVITAFEKYINSLTFELYESIEHKGAIYEPKF